MHVSTGDLSDFRENVDAVVLIVEVMPTSSSGVHSIYAQGTQLAAN